LTYPLNAVLPNATPQTAPLNLARLLLATLDRDLPRLKRIDHYLHGKHDDPYMPVNADDEYKMLAERCISNWMPLLVATPAEAMYVDTFRRGASVAKADESQTPLSGTTGRTAGSAHASSPCTVVPSPTATRSP
jgi:hypothetical protein